MRPGCQFGYRTVGMPSLRTEGRRQACLFPVGRLAFEAVEGGAGWSGIVKALFFGAVECMLGGSMERAIPILPADDLAAAKGFYVNGQRVGTYALTFALNGNTACASASVDAIAGSILRGDWWGMARVCSLGVMARTRWLSRMWRAAARRTRDQRTLDT